MAPNVDPAIFQTLQNKIDEETAIREELRAIVDNLAKQGRVTQSILSRVHNTASAELQKTVLEPCQNSLVEQVTTVQTLAEAASKYPFYKWNNMWQRDIQNLISNLQLAEWLRSGKLVTIEELGAQLQSEFLPSWK
jgi:predicted translin family RNA/ssDNA-binding protein